MAGVPTCPRCGSQARWYQDANSWGCERCRMMLPQVGGGIQAAAPAPMGSPGPSPMPGGAPMIGMVSPGMPVPGMAMPGGSIASMPPAMGQPGFALPGMPPPGHPGVPAGHGAPAGFGGAAFGGSPGAGGMAGAPGYGSHGYGGMPGGMMPMGQPQMIGQPMMPNRPMPPPTTVPVDNPMRRKLMIAAVLVVVAAAVAIILVLQRGKAGPGYAESLNDAAHKTFEALGDGDSEALIHNAGMEFVKQHVTCRDDDPDREKEETDMRNSLRRAAQREKGAKFEVKNFDELETRTIHKGEKAGVGCKADIDMISHELRVEVEMTRGVVTQTLKATMTVVEIDGQYLVFSAPKIPGCSEGIARVMTLEQKEGSKRHLDVDQCLKERWPESKIDCLAHSITLADVDLCFGR